MKTIGLVMIVKNEGRSLQKCLARAKNLVDEIYITDTGSTDQTIEIAEKFHAHISHFKWSGDFAAARNYALAQSPCDWNLILDADEYLISGKRKDIQRFVEKGGHAGAIQRQDSYRETNGEISKSHSYITRLIPRGASYEGRVHEQVISSLPIAPLPLIFEHDGYLQDGKGERNLEILLQELEETPEDPYVLYQVSRTLWLMKDFERADRYFEEFYGLTPKTGTGYRTGGVISYIYNLLELKKYEKGFEIIELEKGRLAPYADYHFACGTFYTQAIFSDVQRYVNYLPLIEQSYMRCLEIGEVPEHEGVLGNGSFKAAYNLGVWYEVNGDSKKALNYYRMAQARGYQPAKERIKAVLKA
ncbi:MAG: glycosyltransferase family 2 protein [Ruminococcus sp.]|nr:glycosyltransferase family 2 protein [Ruminococcus sp.]